MVKVQKITGNPIPPNKIKSEKTPKINALPEKNPKLFSNNENPALQKAETE